MEQSLYWQANYFSASQEIPLILWNPKVPHRHHKCLLPVPALKKAVQVQGVLLDCFATWYVFYGEDLLAPRPTSKLEDHTLSAVRDCLFNIFTATYPIGGHDRCGKTPYIHEFDPRTAQPVASRFTDWVIPAHPAAKVYRSESVR